jgi:integrase
MKGSLVHYKDNVWHYTLIIGYKIVEGVKKPIRKKFTIYADKRTGPNGAEEQAEKIWDKFKSGDRFWEADKLFSEYTDAFLKSGKPQWASNSYAWYKQHFELHILPAFGHLKLSSLKRAAIKELIDSKYKYSPYIARHIHQILHAFYQYLIYEGIVKENILDTLKPPELPYKEQEVWTIDQVKIFLNAVRKYRYHLVYFVCFTTGMRINEVLGLRWRDISFEDKTIKVRKRLNKPGLNPSLGKPKTKKSIRAIRMIPKLIEELKRHKTEQKKEKLAAGEFYRDFGEEFSDLVFAKQFNGPVSYKYLTRKEFIPAITACQKVKSTWIPKIRIHDLRHSAATYLIDIGTPVEIVAEILGHSTPTFTKAKYVKDNIKRQEKPMERMNQDFA